MKYLILVLVSFALSSPAQESKQFIIDGKVKQQMTVEIVLSIV